MAKINHGTLRGYRAGCRCEKCRKANADAKRRERDRRREREGKPPRRSHVVTVPTSMNEAEVERTFDKIASAEESGPIEREARVLLAEYDDDAVTRVRREVIFRAASIMDDPKKTGAFKDCANVMRAYVADILAGLEGAGGQDDDLTKFMETLSASRRTRGSPTMDDASQSSP